MRRATRAIECGLWAALVSTTVACGDDQGSSSAEASSAGTVGESDTSVGSGNDTSATSASSASTGAEGPADESGSGSEESGGIRPGPSACTEMAPPPGAAMPPALPAYGGGTCPALVPGPNTITSSGNMRSFLLVAPQDLSPDEELPLVFMWHWLGGDANAFLERGDVQNAVDQMRFLAIIPEEKGDLLTNWPYTLADSQARLDEELVFFDDLLACAGAAYPIVPHCVASVGVSSGALMTSQLASARGQHLSSFMSLSGGTGGVIKPWNGSPHIMPALVLWGGPTDACGPLNFEDASHDLENGLGADGHFMVECVHNCGHSTPPFDVIPDTTLFMPLWKFVLDHPYWLTDGESPWSAGLPDGLPEWCAIGAGNATIRVGECGGSEC